ncbi:helix-turn-helix transcriptional regulator [Boseongicola sp. H5]|uniref:helix-turn-helix domain-containing protein n=1 Tax=Boseongicola sp. H5 TaxID=2763261 RepID=UPI001D0A32E1|nr:helix-turn-helix transcriptional regulator [Boseongicola sp. H5]
MRGTMFEVLKQALRARQMTYGDLAARMSLSEPTIKRIFASGDAKMSRIMDICDALDLPFEDIVATAKRTIVRPVQLTAEMEAGLAQDPSLFFLFILLHDGMAEAPIREEFGLSRNALFILGRKLERLGLAEVHAEGRIRLTLAHPVKFRRNGPLHRTLRDLNLAFVRKVFDQRDGEQSGYLTQSRRISRQTARQVMADLRNLNQQLSEMARQDQLTVPAQDLQTYKLCVAWSEMSFPAFARIDGEAPKP